MGIGTELYAEDQYKAYLILTPFFCKEVETNHTN